MPSSWITALKIYNSQDTNINEPHKSVWAIPKKNTKAMEEVRALMPRGAPGGSKIVHGQKAKPLPTQLPAETLAKLKQVEAETAERNIKRKFDSKVKTIMNDFEQYKNIIEMGQVKTVGQRDNLVQARDFILKRREQLRDPKNKELFEALKDKEIMTYKIPEKVMKMKLSTEEKEPEPEEVKTEEPKNNFPFLKKMVIIGPNLADLLDIELTASQKSLLKAVEKIFDSRAMPEKIQTESGECSISKENKVVFGLLSSITIPETGIVVFSTNSFIKF